MERAIELSKKGMESGDGGPFGAVIVKDGVIVGEGNNKVTSTNDPTAHAEMVAIRNACKKLGTFDLKGCEIYTSCEPCPMCLSACYWARLDKIYYANTRKDAANIGFDDDFIYKEIPLSIENRSLPMEHIKNEKAKKVFDDWLKKEDKVEY
jgi:tRNA(Arg) A34 adenosine deaminase TadA